MAVLEQAGDILQVLVRPFTYVVNLGERIHWAYLLVALLIARLAFLQANLEKPASWREFWKACFPKSVYFHRSAMADYQIFLLNPFLEFLLILPLTAGIMLLCSSGMQNLLADTPLADLLDKGPLWASMLHTLFLALVMDFALFLGHYLQHKIPPLWEFHKTHHSAEVLQPLTVYRMHPLDNLLNYTFTAGLVGLADGAVQTLFVHNLGFFSAYGTNVLFLVFYLLGYNLRHSQIWVDYGPFWDRIFISPAQHQIHHSQAPRHFDKNMGFIFACWDRWFGTLYVPKEREELQYGLNPEGEHREYASVWQLYLLPFRKVFRRWPRWSASVVLLLLLLTGGSTLLIKGQASAPPSVHLEELTWTEVRERIRHGATVAIVPTGGTEQNGPHMVLGKHNYVVRHTTERIARELGNTLVAPVLTYVPEGNTNPPEGHMRFAGTLSVPEPVFEATLEGAARSLKTHGFKLICFVGDSGGNQKSQARVAERLNREWQGSGTRVLHVGDYYLHHGQVQWLGSQGETPEDIGTHAGIRDTSELLQVYPQGVRRDKAAKSLPTQEPKTGVIGNPTRASAETGKAMLDLKIQAALRQIRKAQRRQPNP